MSQELKQEPTTQEQIQEFKTETPAEGVATETDQAPATIPDQDEPEKPE